MSDRNAAPMIITKLTGRDIIAKIIADDGLDIEYIFEISEKADAKPVSKKRTSPTTGYTWKMLPVVDHKGNTYKNKTQMCKAYDVSPQVYNYRRRKGWTVQEALTGETSKKHNREYGKEFGIIEPNNIIEIVYDHEGNGFMSIKEMCEHWNMSYKTYKYRMEQGMTQEEALTTPSRRRKTY